MGFQTLGTYFPVLKNRIYFSPLCKRFGEFILWSEDSKKNRMIAKKDSNADVFVRGGG
ncbi:hypothetical protein LEP1GSC005_2496 [Leptospira santarosai str. ST188]|nr:hypothetical protein LEP1GSC005_2496 [Leptospira santarosai str. ST188]EMO70175.1 hypothetical protein LEP1GSC130_3133 [Leptospira santarosai str. 200403458]EMO97196.1 hypothetical protein LEP1GSC120_3895 [Leptospira santarosai str. 200702252]